MLLSSVIVIPPVGMFLLLTIPPPIPQETAMPDPNGYDTLVRVAEQIEYKSIPATDNPTTIELIIFEDKYQGLLADAHDAVNRQCRANPVTGVFSLRENLEWLHSFRKLRMSFAAQGKLAEIFGDNDDAIDCYIDQLQLGKAVARGGESFHTLIGLACEGNGLENLRNIIKKPLPQDKLDKISGKLRSLQVREESVDVIVARDDVTGYYSDVSWMDRIDIMLGRITKEESDIAQGLPKFFARIQSLYRILLIEIALVEYHHKHGGYPEKLDELVPDFLDALPEEPHGADAFIYRQEVPEPNEEPEDGYELYSPGPNLQDDGGKKRSTSILLDDVFFYW